MSHSHLRLQLRYGFKCNTYYNQKRRTSECNASERASGADIDDKRKYRDNIKEQSSYKRDSSAYLSDILYRWSSGTCSLDHASVFLEIICNFNRIERNFNIEICKCDNQYKHQSRIKP